MKQLQLHKYNMDMWKLANLVLLREVYVALTFNVFL
jgi:hypothetical protein